ncbi:hypothetical protein BGZ80_001714 [Entomortierella chlamydospora]|uniref:Uncharacterized protein n=1 Tax=Entomortierella chlamydospora TaxID=101097 RepID=A0A9P6MQU6_9FUNG|nr:hypothetical protein BGZ79_010480 [Entomortierella chlamydospora]KAG0010168.1 hypothetical protein BGZ80_001714 [Entomortierella chlamydospora]
MGILSPVCMTSDGTRLYAFAYGSNGSGRSFSYVLIKSNSVPSYTLNDLSWTLVSTLGGPNVYSMSLNAYSCVVDDMGVFTIVSSAFNGTGTASKGMTLGLQYQPPGDTSGGSGTWSNVYAPSGYTYSSTNTLFFLKDSSGKDTLMKAYT